MRAGVWVAGARLHTLPATVGPVLMGGGIAWLDGVFAALPFVAALSAALWIQIGTNFANDYSDFVRGADTEARLGNPRVTQTGQLSPGAVRAAAGVCFAIALAIGVYLVARGGWPIFIVGFVSVAAGVAYTGGPWPFGYHGLGDLVVWVFFGPVAVAGTYYAQALVWSPASAVAGVGIGAFVTAILVVNNLRDRDTDLAAGKRTLAVQIGVTGTRAEYGLLLAVAGVVPVAGLLAGWWPPAAALATAAVSLALPSLRTVLDHDEDPRALNPALGKTARAAGIYGVVFAIGCLI